MAPMKLPAHGRASEDSFDSYSLTHLAHLLHVTRRRIRQMLQKGDLPFVEVRGQIRVPRSAIVMRKGNCGARGS
jgi:excisionase family DNA binding protein